MPRVSQADVLRLDYSREAERQGHPWASSVPISVRGDQGLNAGDQSSSTGGAEKRFHARFILF